MWEIECERNVMEILKGNEKEMCLCKRKSWMVVIEIMLENWDNRNWDNLKKE